MEPARTITFLKLADIDEQLGAVKDPDTLHAMGATHLLCQPATRGGHVADDR